MSKKKRSKDIVIKASFLHGFFFILINLISIFYKINYNSNTCSNYSSFQQFFDIIVHNIILFIFNLFLFICYYDFYSFLKHISLKEKKFKGYKERYRINYKIILNFQ